jgi:histidyl-tRNA synthetase
MREANKLGASKVIFIGGEEYERGSAVIKNMSDSSQKEVLISEII